MDTSQASSPASSISTWTRASQRGSTESKALVDRGRESDKDRKVGRFAAPDSPPVPVGVSTNRLLPLAEPGDRSVLLPVLGCPLVAGTSGENSDQLQKFQAPISMAEDAVSPGFWNRTLQNWQSEFRAVGSIVVLSIHFRALGSPESKPVGSSNESTGVGR